MVHMFLVYGADIFYSLAKHFYGTSYVFFWLKFEQGCTVNSKRVVHFFRRCTIGFSTSNYSFKLVCDKWKQGRKGTSWKLAHENFMKLGCPVSLFIPFSPSSLFFYNSSVRVSLRAHLNNPKAQSHRPLEGSPDKARAKLRMDQPRMS